MSTKKEKDAQQATNNAWTRFIEDRDRIQNSGGQLAFYRSQHPLWTPEMASVLPSSAEIEKDPDPICYYRFIGPWDGPKGPVEWFIMSAETRGDDVIFMCYACLGDPASAEPGYVSLRELRAQRGPFLLNVELERYFTPVRYSKIRAEIQAKR